MLEIRNAEVGDLEDVARLEEACFSQAERADRQTLRRRLEVYPNHFWLLERDGKLVSMVNGMTNDNETLLDEMYTDESMHKEDGSWQFLFGVETDPAYRHKGYASILMKEVIKDCINDSRKGIILTCKEELIPFYEKLGFESQGLSASVHGGEKWYQMKLSLEEEI